MSTTWTGMVDGAALRADLARYAFAALLVGAVAAGLGSLLRGAPPSVTASATESAVLIDLPPAQSSSRPAGDDGPEQAAAPAAVAQAAPETPPPEAPPPTPVAPPKAASPPVDPPPPPPPPVAPTPAAVLPPPAEAPPPKPVVAPPSPPQAPQVETAPSGADARVETDTDSAEAAPHASARLMAVWQKAMMRRLEAAKRSLGHSMREVGSVTVGFAIDASGKLVAEHVARSSGSQALDKAALTLIDRAAPFPAPPAGAGASDLSFTVPVVFKR